MVGYVDSDPPQKRRSRRLGWPLVCLFVGVISSGATYFFCQSPPLAEHPLWIGYPLEGEAIYYAPTNVMDGGGSGVRLISGNVKYVIRNVAIYQRPVVIQFPPRAAYSEDSIPNAYNPRLNQDNWPEFAQRRERIFLRPGESRTFWGTYNVMTHKEFSGISRCFVFSTEAEPNDLGEAYDGCLSFPAKMDMEEEQPATANVEREAESVAAQ